VEIVEWWPKLDSETREWLGDHNGDAASEDVLAKIAAAGASVASQASWVGEVGPDGFHISDEAVDWIEATANGESA